MARKTFDLVAMNTDGGYLRIQDLGEFKTEEFDDLTNVCFEHSKTINKKYKYAIIDKNDLIHWELSGETWNNHIHREMNIDLNVLMDFVVKAENKECDVNDLCNYIRTITDMPIYNVRTCHHCETKRQFLDDDTCIDCGC